MYQVKRSGYVGFEDLMRELAVIEHDLLKENSAAAMSLMALEAKIRDRFLFIQNRIPPSEGATFTPNDSLSIEEIQALIPQDLSNLPDFEKIEQKGKQKKIIQTVGWAAVLAIITAVGVFGLASILQMVLNWVS